jgi:hypothetical protein
MSWWKSIISQWQTLPFPHSNLRPEYKQLQYSCQKSGVSMASLPLLRSTVGPCSYILEPTIRKPALLSPFWEKSHSFHQTSAIISLKPDTLELWSHLSLQANQSWAWFDLTERPSGRVNYFLWLITWMNSAFLWIQSELQQDSPQILHPSAYQSLYGITVVCSTESITRWNIWITCLRMS